MIFWKVRRIVTLRFLPQAFYGPLLPVRVYALGRGEGFKSVTMNKKVRLGIF
jgi:hypothetical protein